MRRIIDEMELPVGETRRTYQVFNEDKNRRRIRIELINN